MMYTLNSLMGLTTTPTIHFATYIPHSKLYEKSLLADGIQPTDETFQYRSRRIQKSQFEYSNLFAKLDVIIAQLQEKYPRYGDQQPVRVEEDVVSIGTDPSSGASTSSETRTASSCTQSSRKRRICLEDDYIEIDEYEHVSQQQQNQLSPQAQIYQHLERQQPTIYPKRLNSNPSVVILGPKGTQIPSEYFDTIAWTTAAASTRSLLAIVFSSDVLATHTLTGKPSPAFYGRERPPKLQLDADKTADIIHCVRAMCGSGEREIRAAITTKCADTAKKLKRRSLKMTGF